MVNKYVFWWLAANTQNTYSVMVRPGIPVLYLLRRPYQLLPIVNTLRSKLKWALTTCDGWRWRLYRNGWHRLIGDLLLGRRLSALKRCCLASKPRKRVLFNARWGFLYHILLPFCTLARNKQLLLSYHSGKLPLYTGWWRWR